MRQSLLRIRVSAIGLMYWLGRRLRADVPVEIPGDWYLARIYANLGIVYHDTGKPDRAIKYYTRAMQLQGTIPSTLFARGELYDQRGAYQDARRDFGLALHIDRSKLGWMDRDEAKAYLAKLSEHLGE